MSNCMNVIGNIMNESISMTLFSAYLRRYYNNIYEYDITKLNN